MLVGGNSPFLHMESRKICVTGKHRIQDGEMHPRDVGDSLCVNHRTANDYGWLAVNFLRRLECCLKSRHNNHARYLTTGTDHDHLPIVQLTDALVGFTTHDHLLAIRQLAEVLHIALLSPR